MEDIIIELEDDNNHLYPKEDQNFPKRDLIISNESRALSKDIKETIEEAKRFADISHAKNTKLAYTKDWEHFTTWCKAKNLDNLPAKPQTIALYFTDYANEYKVSTLERKLSAIGTIHRNAGYFFDPKHIAFQRVFRGIKREKGAARKGKDPLMVDQLKLICEKEPENIKDIRDRAILLLGFSMASRRSEIVNLTVDDIKYVDEGLQVIIRKSKSDQEGHGRTVGVPYGTNQNTCPVYWLEKWIDEAKVEEGFIFKKINRWGHIDNNPETHLSDKAVNLIVKEHLERVGINPDAFGAHSLRAGHVTSAAAADVPEWIIQKQTGHKRADTLRGYIRMGELFKKNSSNGML